MTKGTTNAKSKVPVASKRAVASRRKASTRRASEPNTKSAKVVRRRAQRPVSSGNGRVKGDTSVRKLNSKGNKDNATDDLGLGLGLGYGGVVPKASQSARDFNLEAEREIARKERGDNYLLGVIVVIVLGFVFLLGYVIGGGK